MIDEDELEQLPSAELLQRTHALAAADASGQSDELWRHVWGLHRRPEESVHAAAAAWCASENAWERRLGADVLAQLGHSADCTSPFGLRSLTSLEKLLDDDEPTVLESAVTALGHLASNGVSWEPDQLAGLATHSDSAVRHAVAYALGGAPCDEFDTAVEILLALTEDPASAVRDWACFGLGQSNADSVAIRDALAARLDDADEVVRGESLVGLARRADQRAVDAILEELSGSEVLALAVEAAGEDPRAEYVPDLERLAAANPDDETVVEVLARCRAR